MPIPSEVYVVLVASARRVGIAERMWAPDFRDRMLVLARPSSR